MFGVEIEGDARAYPLRILDWHEMLNDVVGGVPVALAYCTLCGSGILYDARVAGRERALRVRLLGLPLPLQQADVRPGDPLLVEPVHRTAGGRPPDRLGDRARGPAGDHRALAGLARGASRNQGALARHRPRARLHAGQAVWRLFRERGADVSGAGAGRAPGAEGLRLRAAGRRARRRPGRSPPSRAAGCSTSGSASSRWCWSAMPRAAPCAPIVRTAASFAAGVEDGTLQAGDERWRIEESALVGPQGERLARLPGHIAYWFAWQAFIQGAPLALARQVLSRAGSRRALPAGASACSGHGQSPPRPERAAQKRTPPNGGGVEVQESPKKGSQLGSEHDRSAWERKRRRPRPPVPTSQVPCQFRTAQILCGGVNPGGVDLLLDVRLELREVALEAAGDLARLGVVGLRILPAAPGVEHLAAARPGRSSGISRPNGGCSRKATSASLPSSAASSIARVCAQADALAGAVGPAAPAGVDQPAVGVVPAHQLAQHLGVDRRVARHEGRAEAGREGRLRLLDARPRCRRPGRCSRTGNGTSPARA